MSLDDPEDPLHPSVRELLVAPTLEVTDGFVHDRRRCGGSCSGEQVEELRRSSVTALEAGQHAKPGNHRADHRRQALVVEACSDRPQRLACLFDLSSIARAARRARSTSQHSSPSSPARPDTSSIAADASSSWPSIVKLIAAPAPVHRRRRLVGSMTSSLRAASSWVSAASCVRPLVHECAAEIEAQHGPIVVSRCRHLAVDARDRFLQRGYCPVGREHLLDHGGHSQRRRPHAVAGRQVPERLRGTQSKVARSVLRGLDVRTRDEEPATTLVVDVARQSGVARAPRLVEQPHVREQEHQRLRHVGDRGSLATRMLPRSGSNSERSSRAIDRDGGKAATRSR